MSDNPFEPSSSAAAEPPDQPGTSPVEVSPQAQFHCDICDEPSSEICVRCTQDACENHLCEKCRQCSDCCTCEQTAH